VNVTLPFVCPWCRARSWDPMDAEAGWCSWCQRFVSEAHPSSPSPSIEAAKQEESPAPELTTASRNPAA
jgi:hypothetical protein